MKAVAVLVLGCVLGPALGFAQGAAGPNVISQVQVKGHTVEITGSARASFNTFTLEEPTRLVIDISEAVFSGVPAEVPVEGSEVVAGVQTLSDSEEGTPIARVVIGFSQEVETDIEARGTTLVVSVADAGGPVEVARAPAPTRPEPPAGTVTGQPPGTQVAVASTQAEQPPARATAEEKKREEEARRQAELEEKQRREAEARAAAEEKKRQEEAARRQAELEEKQRREAEARAAAEEKKRQAEARRQAEREERQRREAEAKVVRVARAEQPEQAEDEPQAASSRRGVLTLVGFRQESGVARVFIRTDVPVRYSLSREGSLVLVELENTRIGQGNNTRRLDTSFFQTAVSSVEPRPGPGGRSVQVAIRLKQPVPYKTRQEGNEVSIEFSAPP